MRLLKVEANDFTYPAIELVFKGSTYLFLFDTAAGISGFSVELCEILNIEFNDEVEIITAFITNIAPLNKDENIVADCGFIVPSVMKIEFSMELNEKTKFYGFIGTSAMLKNAKVFKIQKNELKIFF